jgi:Flp pilus assembly protein TadB
MYCPHCGTQNLPETKYCRSCGRDLRLVAQAITKSLPLVIAQKVDDAIDRGRGGWRSYQLFRAENRRPYAQALMGLSALFVVVWMLMLGHGSISFASGFLLVMTASLLLTSVRELLARNTRKRALDELSNTVNTKELIEPNDLPSASVTESTTRGLDSRVRVKRRK